MYSKIQCSLIAVFVPCFKNSSLFLVSLLMDLILYQHLTLRFFSLVLISSYLHLSSFSSSDSLMSFSPSNFQLILLRILYK